MIPVLLVSGEIDRFLMLEAVLSEHGFTVNRAVSGSMAISGIMEGNHDLIIADEQLSDMTGMELAKIVVRQSPMTSLALVSTLPDKDFHQSGEGLGILMQLSFEPGQDEAEKLIGSFKHVLNLSGKIV